MLYSSFSKTVDAQHPYNRVNEMTRLYIMLTYQYMHDSFSHFIKKLNGPAHDILVSCSKAFFKHSYAFSGISSGSSGFAVNWLVRPVSHCLFSTTELLSLTVPTTTHVPFKRLTPLIFKRTYLLVYCTSNGTQFFVFKVLHKSYFTLKVCMRIEIVKP